MAQPKKSIEESMKEMEESTHEMNEIGKTRDKAWDEINELIEKQKERQIVPCADDLFLKYKSVREKRDTAAKLMKEKHESMENEYTMGEDCLFYWKKIIA